MRLIAFCGPKSCGKDTAAKKLFTLNDERGQHLFRRAPMAEGVKNICHDFFGWSYDSMDEMEFKETKREWWPNGPVLEPRWAMMDIANWLRDKYGGEIHAERWAHHTLQIYAYWGAHVVTDMRFPEELQVFERVGGSGFLPIYVERPEAEEALTTKQQAGDQMALNPSEAHYTMLRQYCKDNGAVIHNNRTIEHLHAEVASVVCNKFTHWQYWKVK